MEGVSGGEMVVRERAVGGGVRTRVEERGGGRGGGGGDLPTPTEGWGQGRDAAMHLHHANHIQTYDLHSRECTFKSSDVK